MNKIYLQIEDGSKRKIVLIRPLLTNKRWLKVRFFGNFIKADQYKKHIVCLLLQLLEPKRLLAQPLFIFYDFC
jgi:hypothetical protein